MSKDFFFFVKWFHFLRCLTSLSKKNLKSYSIIDKYERSFLNWPFFSIFRMIQSCFFFNKKILYEFLKCEIQVLGKCHLEHYWIHRRLCPHLHFNHDLISHLRFVHSTSSSWFLILVMVIRLDKIRSPVAFFFFPLDLDPDSSSSFIQLDLCY